MRTRRSRTLLVAVPLVIVTVVYVFALQQTKSAAGMDRKRSSWRGALANEDRSAVRENLEHLNKAMNLMDAELERVSSKIFLDERGSAASPRHRTRYPLTNASNTSIFVSFASYRDPQCMPTLHDMYTKAARPEDIFVGVVEQHGPNDPACVIATWSDCSLKSFCPWDNIRIRRIAPKDARGPTFGRYVAMLMYRGEKYFMQIDSHNRFVPQWDRIVVGMYMQQQRYVTKPVLSHYPEAFDAKAAEEGKFAYERNTTSYLCKASFLSSGILRFDGVVIAKPEHAKPQPWAAGGFMFADALVLHEVPFDPHLDFLFDGEEILYSARLWTSGWNVFSPTQNVMYHMYGRPDAPKVFDDMPGFAPRQYRSTQRVQYLLEVKKIGENVNVIPDDTTERHIVVEADTYGMGTVRSLDQFWQFAGINMVDRVVKKDWCAQ